MPCKHKDQLNDWFVQSDTQTSKCCAKCWPEETDMYAYGSATTIISQTLTAAGAGNLNNWYYPVSTGATNSIIGNWYTTVNINQTYTGQATQATQDMMQWLRVVTFGIPTAVPETPEQTAERIKKQEAASKRAEELLLLLLSEPQRESWKKEKRFDVIVAGKVYRLRKNDRVQELDAEGKPKFQYCIHPSFDHGLPAEDTVIAQKLLLEADEQQFLKVANRSAA